MLVIYINRPIRVQLWRPFSHLVNHRHNRQSHFAISRTLSPLFTTVSPCTLTITRIRRHRRTPSAQARHTQPKSRQMLAHGHSAMPLGTSSLLASTIWKCGLPQASPPTPTTEASCPETEGGTQAHLLTKRARADYFRLTSSYRQLTEDRLASPPAKRSRDLHTSLLTKYETYVRIARRMRDNLVDDLVHVRHARDNCACEFESPAACAHCPDAGASERDLRDSVFWMECQIHVLELMIEFVRRAHD